jgi:hypothetical protein
MNPWYALASGALCLAIAPRLSLAQQADDTLRETSTEEVEHCVAQHALGRQLRLEEHWFEARTAMNDCASERCPLAIAAD